MKYIDKTTVASQEAKRKLDDWRDNFVYQQSNYSKHPQVNSQYDGKRFNQICSAMKTRYLWDLHGGDNAASYTRGKLKIDLAREQNSLCCYCCDILEGKEAEKDFNDVLEHFADKGTDSCGRMYDYKNLLLACHGDRHKFIRAAKGDTWATIAARFKVAENDLRHVEENKDLNSPFKLGVKIKIPSLPQHCDVSKKASEIKINPVTDKNCWRKFVYKSDGSIEGVNEKGVENKEAKEAIRVLQLDEKKFRERRKEVWNLAKQAYDEDSYIQPFIEKKDIKAIFDYFKYDAFCVVYWAYFAKQLNLL